MRAVGREAAVVVGVEDDLGQVVTAGQVPETATQIVHGGGDRGRDGRLVAMAGERLRLPGHVELSAICVHPDARGRGHGMTLTLALMRLALDGGEVPFLHVRPENVGAVGLYERLGFRTRRQLVVLWRRPR